MLRDNSSKSCAGSPHLRAFNDVCPRHDTEDDILTCCSLAIPGGGVGIFNGCTDEWGAPAGGWGAQYGGISSNTCSTFPQALQSGCNWRFGDFFEGADNPTVDYKQVTCPKALTDKTGCIRSGETPTGNGDSSSSIAAPASSAPPPSSAAPPASSAAPVSSAAPLGSSASFVPIFSSSSSSAAGGGSSSSVSAPLPSSSAPGGACEVEYVYV